MTRADRLLIIAVLAAFLLLCAALGITLKEP